MQSFTLPLLPQPLATFEKAAAIGQAEFTRDILTGTTSGVP